MKTSQPNNMFPDSNTKKVPSLLKQHILPFNWEVESVWALNTQPREALRTQFDYLLRLPLWSSKPNVGLLFDLCPIEVLNNPGVAPHQHQRIKASDTLYPIDFAVSDGRYWILDGVHRLAKLYRQNMVEINIREHPLELVRGLN